MIGTGNDWIEGLQNNWMIMCELVSPISKVSQW